MRFRRRPRRPPSALYRQALARTDELRGLFAILDRYHVTLREALMARHGWTAAEADAWITTAIIEAEAAENSTCSADRCK